jgi:hypothetical protein
MVVRTFGPEEGLQNATCQRTICANGCLAEVVRLKGSGDGLTDEELEEFIASFPMEAVGNRVPHS